MSVEIWPPISPTELKIQEDATQARELTWLLTSLRTTLEKIKRGLEDCCALLAPADSAGSTLVLTTPRNETVKGHTTRVGARLVRGLVHLRLRTLPPQTLSLDPSRPVRVPALIRLDALLSLSLELCLALEKHQNQTTPPPSAPYLASQLRLLALHIAEAAALVKGPPQPPARPSTSASTASREGPGRQEQKVPLDTAWTTNSVSLGHFTPPLSRNLSLYVTIQDACLVIYLRALEPADAPVNFGTKLALAIGTTRRIEHDEADRVFSYRCDDESRIDSGASTSEHHGNHSSNSSEGTEGNKKEVEVYVREKVRVESADPSLLSLSAKLSALGNTLGLARRNLAAVMEQDLEE
ncbi:RAVE subunit 2/Rogdi [Daldinia vernicosa]|uniref:RAVE subunit 2/Rogdi n=1 Tax=Daldinia vernicosa TaxID=114800 RepID=UPI002007590A|nr:RAVE subunit 2/Rogdi [Daldinia vernicosa]KAI0848519.1 RAVE subunit 2/Rogdi [Daldinia vernicosa]